MEKESWVGRYMCAGLEKVSGMPNKKLIKEEQETNGQEGTKALKQSSSYESSGYWQQ
jgi:hypothetical protein